MIEKILSALKKREEELSYAFTGEGKANDLVCISKIREVEHCIKIVKEVAKEYKAPIRCLTCARYTDADEIDNGCYLCCKGMEDNYKAREGERCS